MLGVDRDIHLIGTEIDDGQYLIATLFAVETDHPVRPVVVHPDHFSTVRAIP